jgi:phosphatidate cytidylyltransferase
VPGGELGTRILSAVVLIPIALAAAYFGGPLWTAFWLIAATLVLWEWMSLIGAPRAAILTSAGALGYAAAAGCLLAGLIGWAVAALAVVLIGSVILTHKGRPLWTAGGFLYGAALLLSCIVLRRDPEFGLLAVVFLFGIVWTSDIAAYFVGRAVGGPKIWARVSPKKTISGALGGTLAAVVIALVIARVGGLGSLTAVALVALILSLVSQGGDFLESAIKRRFSVKDASQLIPGHGGLMDRLDGFITASFLAALIGVARGGFDQAGRGLLHW